MVGWSLVCLNQPASAWGHQNLPGERDKRGRLEGEAHNSDDRLLVITCKHLLTLALGFTTWVAQHSGPGRELGKLTRSKRARSQQTGSWALCQPGISSPGCGQAGTSRSQHAPNGMFHLGHDQGSELGHIGGTRSLPESQSLSLSRSRL